MNNKVLVLGATGGTGQVVVNELLKRHVDVRVFGRNADRLQHLWPNVEFRVGDVFNVQDIVQAGRDVSLIIQCAAIPYHETVARQVPLGQAVMRAAQQLGARVTFIDGLYAYGVRQSAPMPESAALRPVTRKGRAKADLTKLLFSEQFTDVPVALLRLPDYYGPTARKASYLGSTLINIAAHKVSAYIGPKRVQREYVYLPDAAVMIVNVALSAAAYGQTWNIPGQRITGNNLIKIAKRSANDRLPVLTMNKLLLRVSGLFNQDMKEIVEMYYLTQKPIYLAGNKYEKSFGKIVKTPFEVGIEQTISNIQKKVK